MAGCHLDEYPWYTFCRVGEGYVGRMTGIADFNIDADLRTVVCDPAVDGRSHVIPIVIPGTVTAFVLAIPGPPVLHGSAVEIDDRALAFVGVSGQGKSTMAAVFCSAGAALVTDDVLPLAFDHGPNGDETVHCLRGGNEIRLSWSGAVPDDRDGRLGMPDECAADRPQQDAGDRAVTARADDHHRGGGRQTEQEGACVVDLENRLDVRRRQLLGRRRAGAVQHALRIRPGLALDLLRRDAGGAECGQLVGRDRLHAHARRVRPRCWSRASRAAQATACSLVVEASTPTTMRPPGSGTVVEVMS